MVHTVRRIGSKVVNANQTFKPHGSACFSHLMNLLLLLLLKLICIIITVTYVTPA